MKEKCHAILVVLVCLGLFLSMSAAPLLAAIEMEELPERKGLEITDYFIWHTGLSTETVFDGNVFLSDKNYQQDTIFKLSPYMGIEVPMGGENNISVHYQPTYKFFHRFPEQNSLDHDLVGRLEAYTVDHDILVEDHYRRFTNRPGQDETGSSGRRTRQERNDFLYSISAEHAKLDYAFEYWNRIKRYLGKNQQLFQVLNYDDRDYMNNEANVQVGYLIFPNTSIVVESVIGHYNYRSKLVPNSLYLDNLVGLKGELPHDVVYDVRVGVRAQDYFKSDFVRNKDFVDPIARANIEYSWSEDDIFRIVFIREDTESVYLDQTHLTSNWLSSTFIHYWNDKIIQETYATWQYMRYPYESTQGGVTHKRRETIIAGGVNLQVNVNKWVSMKFGYDVSVRNSIFETFDYVDNRGTIQVTAGF